MSQATAVAQVVAGTALFGTVGTVRTLVPEASGASVGAVRVLVAAAVLVPLAVWAGERWTAALTHRAVWVAGAAQAAFQLTFLSAVLRTGVAAGTLLAIGSAPVFAGLLHRRTTRAWAAATAVGVAGLVLLVAGGSSVRLQPDGVVLALLAGLSYAAYTVATGRAVVGGSAHRPAPGPLAVTAGTFVVTAAVLSPALLSTDLSWLGTVEGVGAALWLGLAPTVASYLLLARGLRRLAAPVVSTLGLTEPVVATGLAVAVLGERPTPVGWAGALLVLVGLALTALTATTRSGRVRGSAA